MVTEDDVVEATARALRSTGWTITQQLTTKATGVDLIGERVEKARDWYGISPDTVQRGLAELEKLDLLDVDVQYKTAPLAPEGYTQDRHFTLKAPFGPLRQPLATVTKLKTG